MLNSNKILQIYCLLQGNFNADKKILFLCFKFAKIIFLGFLIETMWLHCSTMK